MMSNTLQSTARARCGRGGALTGSPLLVFGRRQQQLRTFRLGRIWASHIDNDLYRDICRRQRKLRYKYSDTLDRPLSWEKHHVADDARIALKRMFNDYWHPNKKNFHSRGRYVNEDVVAQSSTDPEGARPGQNIEDVECGPMESLLFGRTTYNYWRSPFQEQTAAENAMTQRHKSRRPRKEPLSSTLETTQTNAIDVEYIIDPITNRKVLKPADLAYVASGKEVKAPVRTYQPQFSPFHPPPVGGTQAPIFYDGPPPEAELKAYGMVDIDSMPWDLASEKPVFESEEYEQNHSSSTVSLIASDASQHLSWKHAGVLWSRNDTIVPTVAIATRDDIDVGSWSVSLELHGSKNLVTELPVVPFKDVIEVAAESGFDDLEKYKPLMGTEAEPIASETSHGYNDLDKYTAVFHNEPNGQPIVDTLSIPEPESSEPGQHLELNGKFPILEDQVVNSAELRGYQGVGYNEPDGKPLAEANRAGVYDPAELQQYRAFLYNEPDGQPPVTTVEGRDGYDPAEVRQYQAFWYHEPDGENKSTWATSAPTRATELRSFRDPRYYNESDGKPITNDGGPTDLFKYEAARWSEPHGKAAESVDATAECLRESDLKDSLPEARSKARNSMESFMSRYAKASDAIDAEVVSSLKQSTQINQSEKASRLTGNYAWDFPEDFTKTWTSDQVMSEEAWSKEQQIHHIEGQDIDGSAPGLPKFQPALNRQGQHPIRCPMPQRTVVDSHLREPQGLEGPHTEECFGESTGSAFARIYDATSDTEAARVAEAKPKSSPLSSPSASVQSTTLYKILAYDAATKRIETAETTSFAAGNAVPLSPAEVLLHLSTPAKFLPYFASLQSQGFEIASGSGNVLVFRKVRESATTAPSSLESAPTHAAPEPVRLAVNPIDKTGSPHHQAHLSPVTGRFASPTGFVNYDLPSASAMPRFVSGIDVRREEPVFSGAKNRASDRASEAGERSDSLPKRVAVGAAWVAGMSYALGVVGEYFASGVDDGKGMGPRRFN